MRLGGRLGHSGSFGSQRCTLGVFGFIRVRLVHSGAPWGALGSCGSLGSSEVVGFTRVRHGGGWVNSVLLGSRGCTLGFDGFILRGWVHSGVFVFILGG